MRYKGTPIDWRRWHELLNIRKNGDFSKEERREYQRYEKIVERRDSQETRRCRPYLKRLLKKHQEEIDNTERFVDDVMERIYRGENYRD